MHFADQLLEAANNSAPICLELNPELATLPKQYKKNVQGIFEFSKDCIDAVADTIAMISVSVPQYQLLGPEGYGVFWLVCQYAKEQGLLVLADAKVAEVGAAAGTVADIYLYKESPINAITVHPYFGSDSLQPCIAKAVAHNKGVFVVLKTKNPGSTDVQDVPTSDESVFEYVAQVVESLGMHHISEESSLSCIGAMVASDYPEEVRYLRTIMPHIPILTPFEVEEDLYLAAFISNGTGAMVTVSLQKILPSTDDWQTGVQSALEAVASRLQFT